MFTINEKVFANNSAQPKSRNCCKCFYFVFYINQNIRKCLKLFVLSVFNTVSVINCLKKKTIILALFLVSFKTTD